MILPAASAVYGAVALKRRQWYARYPSRQRRLRHPVISVGNLTVGGSGKTPIVEHLVRRLLEAGERPAILTRGYARRIESDGVTVVSDAQGVCADLDHSGDEPLMLARALPGVPVLVGTDRYLSGRLAEERLGVTVHVLDDGFQHLTLWRDVNLLVVETADLAERVLPAGRLREPVSAGAAADAVLTGEIDEASLSRIREELRVSTVFRAQRTLGPVSMLSSGVTVEPVSIGPVFAFAGIARPQRLFDDLTAAGWRLGGTLLFRDHHRFTQADVARIALAAGLVQTHVVITTAKDAVRLEPLDCTPLALGVPQIACSVEPQPEFSAWLFSRLARARADANIDGRARPGSSRS